MNNTNCEPDFLLVLAFATEACVTALAVTDQTVETLVPAPRGAANLFQRARECPTAAVVVVYADAVTACACALEKGAHGVEWQQDWLDEASSLFEFRRRHADRCHMGELRQWQSHGGDSGFDGLEGVTDALSDAITPPSRVALKLAEDVIAGSPALREWEERLAASSCLKHEPNSKLEKSDSDAEVIWRDFAAIRQRLDGALNALAATEQKLESERQEYQKQLVAEQAEVGRCIQDSDQTRLELEIANLQIAQLQVELESTLEEAQNAHEKADRAGAEAALLVAERDRINGQWDSYKKETQDRIAAAENELAQSLALESNGRGAEQKAKLSEVQLRFDQQALELDIANIQIAQLQEELELSLREWDALASGKSASAVSVGIEIQPQQVRRLLSWGGHNNVQGRPLLQRVSPALRKRERVLGEEAKLLADSDYFDADWYCGQNGGHLGKINPAEHYLRHGASQGRDPSPRFDTVGYLLTNPDVVITGMNPLVHYLRHGQQEKRSPRPIDNER